MFAITDSPISADELREQVMDPGSGGVCVFEGWVRNENEGRTVQRLEYEVYAPLAIKEGDAVIAEAKQSIQGMPLHHRRNQSQTANLEERTLR